MIIKGTRIRAGSGHEAVARHVLYGPDNEEISVLRGYEAILEDAVFDADAWTRKYAIRHFSISPEVPMEREQADQVVGMLAEEFGFDPDHIVMVEHEKKRAGDAGFDRHWHLLVPEVNPETGRVLSSSHSYARQEKVARMSEMLFRHPITKGRHNRAVIAALGDTMFSGMLADSGVADGPLPDAAYTSDQHQTAKRLGDDLPSLKAAVSDAWQRSDSQPSFEAALAEQGLQVGRGEKANTWIVTDDNGRFMGALHRLAGVRKAQVAERMEVQPTPPAEPQEPSQGRRKAAGVGAAPWIGKGIQNGRQAAGVAARWKERGLKTETSDKAVLVHGDGFRIADFGDRCLLDEATPEAIKALITKAHEEWGGIECHGGQHFLEQAWLEAKRQQVGFLVKGQPDWKPSEATQKAWDHEQLGKEQEATQELPEATPEPPEADYEDDLDDEPAHSRFRRQPEPELDLPRPGM